MAYACVRTDNMSGTTLGKDLFSLRFYNASGKEAEIENGSVVLVGDYLDGQREVRKATAVAEGSDPSKLALIASEEVVKEKSKNALDEFTNKAGSNARGYRVGCSGNVFSVTKEAFSSAAPEVGADVSVVVGGTKLTTETGVKIGKVVAIEGAWYVVEID